eukprot:CAMPEP_0171285218 /NCGR_PEP_ID=MMETSP0790-20130122/68340_1 /TAXON_ID=2925 /ORGANISM="Alexandrium catenella, Strain OF101" /LENGTH=30 /DNA_ID= /DNA_START= /DNA_END= /DNA_ORIENTATION=
MAFATARASGPATTTAFWTAATGGTLLLPR